MRFLTVTNKDYADAYTQTDFRGLSDVAVCFGPGDDYHYDV